MKALLNWVRERLGFKLLDADLDSPYGVMPAEWKPDSRTIVRVQREWNGPES